MREIVKDSTDQGTVVRILDTSGIPFGTSAADTSLQIIYRNLGGITVSVAITSLASAGAAHTDGGFVLIHSGYHRIDLPDAAFATSANDILVAGSVSGGVVIGALHGLVNVNPYDSVRFGLFAIPNVTTGQAGAIPTNTSVNAALASVDTSILAALASVNTSVLGAIVSNNAALFVGIASVDTSILGALSSLQSSALLSNILLVNNVTVSGDGHTGTEWGPAS